MTVLFSLSDQPIKQESSSKDVCHTWPMGQISLVYSLHAVMCLLLASQDCCWSQYMQPRVQNPYHSLKVADPCLKVEHSQLHQIVTWE